MADTLENQQDVIGTLPIVPNEDDPFSINQGYLTKDAVKPAISTSSAAPAPALDPAQIVGSTQLKEAIAMAKELMPPATPFNPALASLLYFTKMGELASQKGSSVFGSIAGAGVAPAAYLMQKEKEKAARDANIGKTAASLATTLSKSPAAEKAYTDSEGKVVYYSAKDWANLNPNQKANLVPYTRETKGVNIARKGSQLNYMTDENATKYVNEKAPTLSQNAKDRIIKRLTHPDNEMIGTPIEDKGLTIEFIPVYDGKNIVDFNFSPIPGTRSAQYQAKFDRGKIIAKEKTAILAKRLNIIPSIDTALAILMSGVPTGQVEEKTMKVRDVFATTFGLDRKELVGQQMLASISNKLAPGMRPAGSGSTSDIEFEAYKSAVLSLKNTAFANYLSLWTLKKVSENSSRASNIESQLLQSPKNYSQKYIDNEINKVDNGLYSKFKTKDKEGNPLYENEAAKDAAALQYLDSLPRGAVFLNQDDDGNPVIEAGSDGKNKTFWIKGFPNQ